jgi:hypothetical protein
MGPVLAFQQRFICLLKCRGKAAQCGLGKVILILGFAILGFAILGFAKAASRGDAEALRLAYPNHAKYRKEAYD